MRTTCGHIKGHLLVVAKIETLPVPVRWRGGPQIHHDIEDGAVRAAHQLRLAVPAAYMQAAYHAPHRAGQAVLYERGRIESGRAQRVRVEGAAEEPALVSVRGRSEQQGTSDARNGTEVHEAFPPTVAPMLAGSRPARCRRPF